MKVMTHLALCATIATCTASAFAAETASPYADMPARSKGNVVFKWGDVNATDFGDISVKLDPMGLRTIAPAPPVGVHPRIFFGPEQIPEIKARLQNTKAGQVAWLNMMAWVTAMKGTYDPKADYAKPIHASNRYRVPLQRSVGTNLAQAGVDYKKLLSGDTSVDPGFQVAVFPLEAFRCLIENDTSGAHDLIKVLETVVKGAQQKRVNLKKEEDRLHPYGAAGELGQQAGPNIAWCYDFLYNFMTPAQQDFFRKEIAVGTNYYAHYGTFEAPNATTSNWCTLDSFYVTQLLSIEGEPGFNDIKFKGQIRSWHNFYTYGWYPSGEGYEGRGKNYQFDDTLVAFGMRGVNLAAHPAVRAYGENLLFNNIQPYRYSFFGHDLWGGTDRPFDGSGTAAQGRWLPNMNDILGLKYLFPNNKRIDWAYRNAVGDDYAYLPDRPDGYNNAMISSLVFAQDYDPANNDPAKLTQTDTYFSPEAGLLITRSGWGTDDLMLSMHTRQDLGGHTVADRNSFILTGAGRIWARMDNHNFTSNTNSVVIVDGQEQPEGVPAKVVAFVDAPIASFMAGDAKYAWDWNWSKAGKWGQFTESQADQVPIPSGAQRVMETPNDFRYLKGTSAYLNKPFFLKDDWLQPGKISAYVKKPNYPVKMAFRTAGVVRGTHSYAVIVDDIQKNDQKAHYDWLMQLPNDVSIAKLAGNDILLSGGNSPAQLQDDRPPKSGASMLLVRILKCDGQAMPIISHDIFFQTSLKSEKPQGANKNDVKTLVIPADSVSPGYKILLMPYHAGEALPETHWDATGTKLSVSWSDQKDALAFVPGADGRTRISVSRGGGPEVTVK